MAHLGIDVYTKHCKKLINRLSKLKSTLAIANSGAYREDQTYSKILIETTFTEDELDKWLYSTNHGCDYVGVFTQSDPCIENYL